MLEQNSAAARMPALRASRGNLRALAALLPVLLAADAGAAGGATRCAFVGAEGLRLPGRSPCASAGACACRRVRVRPRLPARPPAPPRGLLTAGSARPPCAAARTGAVDAPGGHQAQGYNTGAPGCARAGAGPAEPAAPPRRCPVQLQPPHAHRVHQCKCGRYCALDLHPRTRASVRAPPVRAATLPRRVHAHTHTRTRTRTHLLSRPRVHSSPQAHACMHVQAPWCSKAAGNVRRKAWPRPLT